MNTTMYPYTTDTVPQVTDTDHTRVGLERWEERIKALTDEVPHLRTVSEAAMADPGAFAVMKAVFTFSPFLSQAWLADPEFACSLLTDGPETTVHTVLEAVRAARKQEMADSEAFKLLRDARRRLSLAVAVADFAGIWELEQVTGALSDLADEAVRLALAQGLRALHKRGVITLPHPEDPEVGSGLFVLGMGKLGARELNYSSDIDLIVFYDEDRAPIGDADEMQTHFVRLTRNLVKMLEERTRDGYVFRTDLRLRPDPGATPMAMGVLAAETYYESIGQNWERMAMIKARVIAGDQEAGRAFLTFLRPFVWRKNLDFYAIQDIHSIKRQINAERGGHHIRTLGHNVKLGQGGIREIEFFAQTQQLIWGGRDLDLRTPATMPALAALTDKGLVTETERDELCRCYRYLRRVEHRLQMINDEQTQTLPDEPPGFDHLARFLGYADGDAFSADLTDHLQRVSAHYADLFNDAPSLGEAGNVKGNLVFTGGETDPGTLETLRKLGFENAEAVDTSIRNWHHGRHRATRSTRSRQLLTELVPLLLAKLAETPNPDYAFRKFDDFLAGLPAGVQLFSMFRQNPQLLDLVAEIMGEAPKLAEHLSRRSVLLDAVLSPTFFKDPPDQEALDHELSLTIDQARNYEEVLDNTRRWAGDRKFQIGVQMLQGLINTRAAEVAFSNIADTCLQQLLHEAKKEFAEQHGIVPGGECAVLALGKLGSRELMPGSDLDLVFVWQVPDGSEGSDGKRPLGPGQYYTRLCQRLINAMQAPTGEGTLYEVDMRLRPAGNAGPVATTLSAFKQYYERDAWTWELLALTRARVVAGDEAFRPALEDSVNQALRADRNAEQLLVDVAAMRTRVDKEFGSDNPWRLKYLRGGMLDIEFIAQYLQLRHAPEKPEVLSPNTRTALLRLRDAELLDGAVTGDLVEALDLWHALQALLRLTVEDPGGAEAEGRMPLGLKRKLAEIGDAIEFDRLKDKISDIAARSHAAFKSIIADPAEKLDLEAQDTPAGPGTEPNQD